MSVRDVDETPPLLSVGTLRELGGVTTALLISHELEEGDRCLHGEFELSHQDGGDGLDFVLVVLGSLTIAVTPSDQLPTHQDDDLMRISYTSSLPLQHGGEVRLDLQSESGQSVQLSVRQHLADLGDILPKTILRRLLLDLASVFGHDHLQRVASDYHVYPLPTTHES